MEAFLSLVVIAAVAWACWHWFLREWLVRIGAFGFVKGRVAASRVPDEAYYEMVSKELRSGLLKEGLWAKALAQALGDETKARGIYLKLRVEAMKAQAAGRFADWGDADGSLPPSISTVIGCPKCAANLRLPSGKTLNVRCTKCGHEFHASTGPTNHIGEHPSPASGSVGRIGRLTFFWLLAADMLVTLIILIAIKEEGLAAPTLQPLSFATVALISLTVFNVILLVGRFHDIDRSGWWSALGFIPFVYPVVVFYLLVVPGSRTWNRFGPKGVGLFVP